MEGSGSSTANRDFLSFFRNTAANPRKTALYVISTGTGENASVRDTTLESPTQAHEALKNQVRSAVIWRSGTQILGQMLTWISTFMVIRILSPTDYGLFAMTQVVLVLLNMMNGYGLASALVRRGEAGRHAQRQLFGMLLLLNLGLAAAQFVAAPIAASYYRQPIVADLLRVQAVLYLSTPFIALPGGLLSREMDFRKQAQVNFLSALAGAITALAGAWAGMGVWTLIAAPIALFFTRALGLTLAARSWMWPSFDFRGAGDIARFGGIMAAGQIFWFLQSQADVFIAGRLFNNPHQLGLYTTSLFLTQILVNKFVPALNEVAFSAYARIQHDRDAVALGFLKGARLIMLAAMPFYLGLSATAGPIVHVMLGDKWAQAAPLVHWLAIIMPIMTLQSLFAPAADALGRPGISMRNAATGALILPVGFLIGVQWGVSGLIAAWFVSYPIVFLICARRSLPLIGLTFIDMARAIAPPVLASAGMALIVGVADRLLPTLPTVPHLMLLVTLGALSYGGLLFAFARTTVTEMVALVRNRGG